MLGHLTYSSMHCSGVQGVFFTEAMTEFQHVNCMNLGVACYARATEAVASVNCLNGIATLILTKHRLKMDCRKCII